MPQRTHLSQFQEQGFRRILEDGGLFFDFLSDPSVLAPGSLFL